MSAVPADLAELIGEPLPAPVVDNHTHLDHTRPGETAIAVEDALAAAAAVGVTRVVQIGCDLTSAAWSVELADRRADVVAGVALHPTQASAIHAEGGSAALTAALERIAELAEHPRVRVIGETGLDHHWVGPDDVAGRRAQETSFRAHIELAKRTGKVLQIHDRLAHQDVVRVLLSQGAPERVVFHCFSGDADLARLAADHGWYLSFAGPVTFTNAADLREALALTPMDRLQVETDAPYLAPHPVRGRRNASALMPITVRRMAAELDVPLAQLCAQLEATALELYGPW